MPPVKEEKMKVPTYIVTFSDMVTLLLTFFVLLLTLAETQDEVLFEKGKQSFIEAVSSYGMAGYAFNQESKVEFGKETTRYKTEGKSETDEDITVDPEEETLRRIFKELEDQMRITPSQIRGANPAYSVTDIVFEAGSSTLSEKDEEFLKDFSEDLQQNVASDELTIYVVGISRDEGNISNMWQISAERAQAAADYLRGTLDEGCEWAVRSWGAGDGGRWAGEKGVISEQSDIVLSVLGE
ncbi:flagellar motor protein MotS [Anaerohalosphaera lusitana]|uniref:Flagellar motor protein MotS n=1 Tax=Anaerohalosphaera lusitana TaxID=1936003 RepID=A0A1U9NG47_9BACT|nr:flagellar motor protein MotB [Anaerohalosphaera lusitana]AQT66902.1 flagellar motor protein MotS [Anaerohalosphaera lusitana]